MFNFSTLTCFTRRSENQVSEDSREADLWSQYLLHLKPAH